MSIISKVEAGSRRGKVIFAAIILLLTAGGATMVYPFLIMISGTLRSEMDEKDLDLLPAYLMDERVHPKVWMKAAGYWTKGSADTSEKSIDEG